MEVNNPAKAPSPAAESHENLLADKGLSMGQRDNFVKLLAKFINHRESEKKNSEETLFDMFRNEDDLIPMGKFLAALRTFGLRMSDPRLKELRENLRTVHRTAGKLEGSPETMKLNRETFKQ